MELTVYSDSFRVTYQFEFKAWALVHGFNVLPVNSKCYYERRDELVKLMVDGGFVVDHYGYVH